MPVNDAGCLIDPPVSVPIVAGVRSAAKAEEDPPEEPPGTRRSPIGLITFPKKLVSLEEPIANSSQFNFPSKKAPLFHKFFVTVDSYEGIKLFKILLPAVVFTFSVQNKSFTAKGIPLRSCSLFGLLSNFFAFSKAWSNVVVTKALSFFAFSMFFIYACVSSDEDIFLDFILSKISLKLWLVILLITQPPLELQKTPHFFLENF